MSLKESRRSEAGDFVEQETLPRPQWGIEDRESTSGEPVPSKVYVVEEGVKGTEALEEFRVIAPLRAK